MISVDEVVQLGLKDVGQTIANAGRKLIALQTDAGECMFVGMQTTSSSWITDPIGSSVMTKASTVLANSLAAAPMRQLRAKGEVLLMEGSQLPTIRSGLAFPVRTATNACRLLGFDSSTFPTLFRDVTAGAPTSEFWTPKDTYPYGTGTLNVTGSAAAQAFGRALLTKMGLLFREGGTIIARAGSENFVGREQDGNIQYPWSVSEGRMGIDPDGSCVVIGYYTGSRNTTSNTCYLLRLPIEQSGYPVTLVSCMVASGVAEDQNIMFHDGRYGTVDQIPDSVYTKVLRPFSTMRPKSSTNTDMLSGQDYSMYTETQKDNYVIAGTSSSTQYLPLFRSTSLANWGVRGKLEKLDVQHVTYTDPALKLEIAVYTLSAATEYFITGKAWYENYLRTGFGLVPPVKDDAKIKAAVEKWLVEGQIAIVKYHGSVAIPSNVVELTDVYRQYAKAKDKACEKNDFMEQRFNETYTWGQAAALIAKRGATRQALFGPAAVGSIVQADISQDAKGGVIVAPSVSTGQWTIDGKPATGEEALDAYVQGGTGISTVTTFTTLGVIASSEETGITQSRGEYIASSSPNASAPGDGNDTYNFAVPSRSLNGFVDYLRLPVQAGYKGVIMSDVNYYNLGTSIMVIDAVYLDELVKAARLAWTPPVDPAATTPVV